MGVKKKRSSRALVAAALRQLLGEMARHHGGTEPAPFRFDLATQVLRHRTARVETAAGWRRGRARDFALQWHARLGALDRGIRLRHGCEQRTRVRMARR